MLTTEVEIILSINHWHELFESAYRSIFFSPAKAVVVDLWKHKLSVFGQPAFLSTGHSVLTEEYCNGIKCQGYSKLFSGLYFCVIVFLVILIFEFGNIASSFQNEA